MMTEPPLPTALVDWLDDLSVRFLLDLPSSELSSVPRLCFQVEEAQWFYEDFVRPAVAASGAPPLPSLPLRQFMLLLFQHCPLFNGFSGEQHLKAYEEFLAYKVRVPVRGAILVDENMQKVVLVRGWKKGASWSFPRGKINKDEKDLDCAIREVWEETGFDIRSAGLVPDNEDDAKAVDVTMREQHMRLFIFRGVPEDTHFEPKTRKEISGIQWYNIKDLPGLKKQKANQTQGNETASTNKFYMVAPFLGHLKKWISQQRKADAERAKRQTNHSEYVTTGTEDEGELEEESAPERDSGVDVRSEELKKLLSIGGLPTPANSGSTARESSTPNDSANLLAMLQGGARPVNGNQIPRTPFEQTTYRPQQPESPHPHHMRQPSSGQQHVSPPRFPFPPPHMQDGSGRHHSLPTPSVFGPNQPGFPPPNQPPAGFHRLPPHMQQQQHPPHGQSMPPGPPPGFASFGQQNGGPPGMPFNGHQLPPPPQQMPSHMLPPHMQPQAPRQIPPQGAYMAPQGPQGAIGSGPSVPNASQLPAPRLGAEKIRLLDAFRNPASRAAPPTAPAPPGQQRQRPASSHQNALLDLFRKPSGTPQSPVTKEPAAEEVPEPASPTGTDVTVKPATARRPTLNEITRTLPMSKPKVKSPPVTADQQTQAPQQAAPAPTGPRDPGPPKTQARSEPPKERQLFDPNNPMKFTPASLMQPSKPAENPRSRQLPQHSPNARAATSSSPSQPEINAKRSSQNGGRETPPQYKILARPGSSKGAPAASGPAAPPSPLRNTIDSSKPAFHPQVLKRPKEGDAGEEQVADKKDQLLALFGKSSGVTSPPPASTPTETRPAAVERKENADDKKNHLLNLFNTSSSNISTPTAAPAQQPVGSSAPATNAAPAPPTPRIEPEHRPTSSKQPTLNTAAAANSRPAQNPQQQNLLLDLFNSKRTGTPLTSPGTPISPFTLGTPAVEEQKRRLDSLSGGVSGVAAPRMVPPGAPLGRTGTGMSDKSTGSGGEGAKSPQEQKDFLMGFLNGVVRNEGRK